MIGHVKRKERCYWSASLRVFLNLEPSPHPYIPSIFVETCNLHLQHKPLQHTAHNTQQHATRHSSCSWHRSTSSVFPPGANLCMMSMVRRPPVRCQAVADAMIASSRAGLASTDRSLLASLGCADIPMECLSLDGDYVVINKVRFTQC